MKSYFSVNQDLFYSDPNKIAEVRSGFVKSVGLFLTYMSYSKGTLSHHVPSNTTLYPS